MNGVEFVVGNQKACASFSSSAKRIPIVNPPKRHGISNISSSVILQMALKRTARSMVDGPSLARAQKLVAAGLREKLVATPRLPNLAKIA